MCGGIWRYSFAMPDSTRKKNARGVALSPYPRSAKIILSSMACFSVLTGSDETESLIREELRIEILFRMADTGQ